jgi:DNA polymerase III delta prime subunit
MCFASFSYPDFLRVNPVTKTMLKKILSNIAAEENIRADRFDLEALIEKCEGDIRFAINSLQFECIGSNFDSQEEIIDLSSDLESDDIGVRNNSKIEHL